MKPIRLSWDDEWNVGTKLERRLQSDISSGDERRVGRDFDLKKNIFSYLSLQTKFLSVTIQVKGTEQYFPVVLSVCYFYRKKCCLFYFKGEGHSRNGVFF